MQKPLNRLMHEWQKVDNLAGIFIKSLYRFNTYIWAMRSIFYGRRILQQSKIVADGKSVDIQAFLILLFL